jgi:hypothetical protein
MIFCDGFSSDPSPTKIIGRKVCCFEIHSFQSQTQRKPIFPVELSGVFELRAATLVAITIRLVTKVRTAFNYLCLTH